MNVHIFVTVQKLFEEQIILNQLLFQQLATINVSIISKKKPGSVCECVNVKWRQFELDVWTFASSTTKLWNWFPALLLRSLESCQNPNMLMSCESRVQTTPTSHDRFTIWFELVVSFRTIISGAKVYFDAMRFFPSSCWQTKMGCLIIYLRNH